jgi:hypothetical protein
VSAVLVFAVRCKSIEHELDGRDRESVDSVFDDSHVVVIIIIIIIII